MHDNEFKFTGDSTITSLDFSGDGQYSITDGKSWGGTTVTGSGTRNLMVTAVADRKKSSAPADWYSQQVDSALTMMIHTKGGDPRPKELNFAFTGTLTINGTAFNICLGQGSYDDTNNWHMCSFEMKADSNNKNGSLTNGPAYRLEQSGTHEFKVKVK